MIKEIILASKSKVRKKILEENKINCIIEPSNVDEDSIKKSLLEEKASPEIISKNLAELKANRISQRRTGDLVLGADSVIDLNGRIKGIDKLKAKLATNPIFINQSILFLDKNNKLVILN